MTELITPFKPFKLSKEYKKKYKTTPNTGIDFDIINNALKKRDNDVKKISSVLNNNKKQEPIKYNDNKEYLNALKQNENIFNLMITDEKNKLIKKNTFNELLQSEEFLDATQKLADTMKKEGYNRGIKEFDEIIAEVEKDKEKIEETNKELAGKTDILKNKIKESKNYIVLDNGNKLVISSLTELFQNLADSDIEIKTPGNKKKSPVSITDPNKRYNRFKNIYKDIGGRANNIDIVIKDYFDRFNVKIKNIHFGKNQPRKKSTLL